MDVHHTLGTGLATSKISLNICLMPPSFRQFQIQYDPYPLARSWQPLALSLHRGYTETLFLYKLTLIRALREYRIESFASKR